MSCRPRGLGLDTSRFVVSLAVIVVMLVMTTIASVIKSKRDPASRAHAGAELLRSVSDEAGITLRSGEISLECV